MEKRHRIRLTNSILAALGGVLLCLIVLYADSNDALILSQKQIIVTFSLFWLVNFSFIWAVGSGFSDRFKEPSLTQPQMYWASLSCVLAMVLVKGHYEFILLLLFLIMVFGIFRMHGRDFLLYSVTVVVALAAQQATSFAMQTESMSATDRFFLWFVFSTCVLMLSSLCNSVATMRERLHDKNAALEDALDTKNLFLANMSHEIRTPINGVIGMLRLLQRSNLNEDQHHHAELALSSAQNLLTIVTDILDFSRIEAGKMELDNIDFDLREHLSDLAQTMGLRAQEKDLEFILDITGVKTSKVRGDPGRIHQILMNLLGNALKFTRQGEVKLKAELQDEDDHFMFTCSVKDTGIGISQDKLESIFNSFTQADLSSTRSFGGTGLGLTLVRQLCTLMDGEVKVNSVLGYGSEFTFNVKLNKSQTKDEEITPISLGDKRILIVDSNLSANNALARQLRSWGATVHQAYDNNSALATLYETLNTRKLQIFSTVFVDDHVECESGIKLSVTMRQEPEFDTINIVLMSRFIEELHDVHHQHKKIPFETYINKPITPENLLEVFENLYPSLVQAKLDQGLTSDNKEKARVATLDNEEGRNSITTSKNRILLVEDNEVNCKVAEGLLEQFGLDCDVAENGEEAIEKLKQSRRSNTMYHLILMDCQMPVMDGYEATRQIRSGMCGQEYKYVPIIAVTANVMEGDREKCLNMGMNDYLPKPLDINSFAQKLTQWLGDIQLKSNVVKFNKNEPKSQNIPLWDENAALRRVGGKAERLSYLVQLFIKSMPAEFENLHNYLDEEHYELVQKCAHSIKGVSGNMGALKLMDLALKIETSCKKAEFENTKKQTEMLVMCYEETLDELQQYLTRSANN